MIHFIQDTNFRPSIYSQELSDALCGQGIKADFISLGCRWNSKRYQQTISNHRFRNFYATLQTRLFARSVLSRMAPGDVVVLYESASLASHYLDSGFQKALVRKNIRYIPVFPDAWPIVDGWLSDCCFRRGRMATMIGCVTPNLVSLFKKMMPEKPVFLMEEPVQTESFAPDWSPKENEPPIIVWSGPPNKQAEVRKMLPVLESVYRQCPFRLRIVSGNARLVLPTTTVPWEWMPFDETSYAFGFSGSDIAFARYADTPYDRCKGNYKIKTYLAAGCAIVSNPVGYNHELIKPGVNGLFANTQGEWEAAFLRLLRNPEERLAMRKASRELAVQRFSNSAIARQYANVLDPLIGSAQ